MSHMFVLVSQTTPAAELPCKPCGVLKRVEEDSDLMMLLERNGHCKPISKYISMLAVRCKT
jgi:hypothetical protein